jgi:hypothetical protein
VGRYEQMRTGSLTQHGFALCATVVFVAAVAFGVGLGIRGVPRDDPEAVWVAQPAVSVQPVDPRTAGLALYPDEPLTALPAGPLSMRFLVEHRSALVGQAVEARGVVVLAKLGEAACSPVRGGCGEPYLYLADTPDADRDENYDILVRLGRDETNYRVGETVRIRGIVHASKVAMYLRKAH